MKFYIDLRDSDKRYDRLVDLIKKICEYNSIEYTESPREICDLFITIAPFGIGFVEGGVACVFRNEDITDPELRPTLHDLLERTIFMARKISIRQSNTETTNISKLIVFGGAIFTLMSILIF